MTKAVMVPDHDNPQPNGEPGWKPENPAEPVQRINNVWIGKVSGIHSNNTLRLSGTTPADSHHGSLSVLHTAWPFRARDI